MGLNLITMEITKERLLALGFEEKERHKYENPKRGEVSIQDDFMKYHDNGRSFVVSFYEMQWPSTLTKGIEFVKGVHFMYCEWSTATGDGKIYAHEHTMETLATAYELVTGERLVEEICCPVCDSDDINRIMTFERSCHNCGNCWNLV